MTFTFKLSRRLARVRRAIPVLILALAGSCAPGKPIEGGLEPPPPTEVLAIHLFPDSVSLNPSEFVDFVPVAELASGGTTAVPVIWQAAGGTISSTGRYTAGSTAGLYRVIGTYETGLTDTSIVVVTVTAPPPPTLTRINVTPSSAALLPSGSQQFSAVGVMSDGSNSAVSVDWTATGGSVGTDGAYSAPSVAGTYLVVATLQGGTFSDTATITVTVPPPTLSAVVLTPPTASLEFGRTQQFSAVGQLSDGSTTTIATTWTATGGTINANGLYTAGSTAGSFRVIARSATGLADTSSVTVTAPTITGITLTPPTVSLQSGQTQQFSVSASLSNGGTQNNPAVTWTATGGAINGSGLYTAGATAGTFAVIATSGNGRADTSSVTISLPTITAISVTPATVSLGGGQTQQFSASATLSNGATQANPTVTWSATGGSISTGGLYTAGTTAGSFRVIGVSTNGRADTSAVTITAATVSAIIVTPPTANLQTGQSQQFSASANMSDGSTQTNPGVTWSATGGTVNTSGLYTAGSTSGSFRVIAASSNGRADTSTVTITAPTITTITVTPPTANLQNGQTQQFSASATLSNGGTQSNPSVTWIATGGSITTGGLYTAGGTAGTFRVIASSANGVADTSSVTITVATVTAITVTPPTANLQSGQTQQFSASATLSGGGTQSNPSVTWTATGGTITTGGLYTAGGTAGSFQVIAASANGVADTSAVTVTVPTITAIVLTPATTTVAVSGTQQFSVSATLSSGGSQSNPAVTYSATGGSISAGGLFTAGSTAGTFRVIAVLLGGVLADTSQITIASSSEPVYQAGTNHLLATDNFDSYTTKPAGPWDNTPTGTSMTSPGAGGSGKAARITYTPSDFYGGFDLNFSATPHIFVSYWFRINPVGYDVVEGDDTGSGMKWFTLWRPTAPRQTWGANHLGGVNGTTFGTHDNSSSSMPNPVNGASGLWNTVNDGNWHRYTIEAYTGTGTNGFEKCWLDGVKIFDTTGRGYDRSTEGFSLLQIGHDKVRAPLGTRFLDIDDFTAWTP